MTVGKRAVWALTVLGFAIGIALVPLLANSELNDDRELWIALDLVIGFGWIGTGAFAWLRRPNNRVGMLMMGTGFAWYLQVAAVTDVSVLFTAGQAMSNLFVATAIHLLLAFPSGRLEQSVDRLVVGVAYLMTTVGSIVPIFFFDPAEFGCTTGCPENLLLIDANMAFFESWFDGLSVCATAILLSVVAIMIARWREASPPLRRVVTPLFAAGATLMAGLAGLLLIGLFGMEEEVAYDTIYYATLIPFGLVPYLFLASLVQARMLRGGAVGGLVATVGETPGPGGLRDALALALNDPSVELAYWLPKSGEYVDARGRRVELPTDDEDRERMHDEIEAAAREVYDVTLDGERVGAIIHDPSVLEDPDLLEAVGKTAALALRREQLEHELRAKVQELEQSRARMIRFGMAERRRLERDLHDGAQQRLVSLALDLRLARDMIGQDPGRAQAVLDGAADELGQALEELRELARGIHPALLSDRGLDPAVETLARRAPVPVKVEAKLGDRVAEPVELAAYFVVAEALTNVVKYAKASQARVRLQRANGEVIVEVADDGIGGAEPRRGSGLRGLADRIAALGGMFEVNSAPGVGTTVRASIPCE
jgi:signal transduction histidine kinase